MRYQRTGVSDNLPPAPPNRIETACQNAQSFVAQAKDPVRVESTRTLSGRDLGSN